MFSTTIHKERTWCCILCTYQTPGNLGSTSNTAIVAKQRSLEIICSEVYWYHAPREFRNIFSFLSTRKRVHVNTYWALYPILCMWRREQTETSLFILVDLGHLLLPLKAAFLYIHLCRAYTRQDQGSLRQETCLPVYLYSSYLKRPPNSNWGFWAIWQYKFIDSNKRND